MEINYSQIAAKGFPEPIARVYLFAGSDDALKIEGARRLAKSLLDEGFADFDADERDIAPSGETEGARAILASALAAPMASKRRVVTRTNVQRLSKEEQEFLASGLSKLGELSCLILVAGTPIYDAGKVKSGSVVVSKLNAAVVKSGTVIVCDPPSESDLTKRAKALLKSRGKTIDPDALDLILSRAKAVAADRGGGNKSGDIHVLTSELEKAMAYAGERKIVTREDAAAVGIAAVDDNIFALLDAVGSRDPKRALWECDELLRSGDKPDGVAARTFVMLARHLRMVWGAKFLGEKNVTGANARNGLPPDVASVLSGEMTGYVARQSYLLQSLQKQARGWTDDGLRRALARVLASDMAMKGIAAPPIFGAIAPSDDPASNLRLLVVELCGA